jgi:NAD(P)-dependent dehydrogenase (short-subunit alcohol dehydrogenase family)
MQRGSRVQGKLAIVTGGARGIGYAIASLLAQQGARVVIADIDDVQGKAAAKRIGAMARFERLDVRSEAEWLALAERVERRHRRIDVLVNNAGIYLIKPIAKTTLEDLDDILAVNVRGVFLGMKHMAPSMARRRTGSIVNLSSMDGIVASEGLAAYSASKGAVRLMTKAVALEYATKGVRVNSIHPAYVRTRMACYGARKTGKSMAQLGKEFPIGRIGEPIEVAYAALYLASDESRFVTGAELVIDGAATAE